MVGVMSNCFRYRGLVEKGKETVMSFGPVMVWCLSTSALAGLDRGRKDRVPAAGRTRGPKVTCESACRMTKYHCRENNITRVIQIC